MKQVNRIAKIDLEARQIFDEFKEYTDGYRVLFLIHRNKEGGETNNTKVKKIVTKNSKEFADSLYDLLVEKDSSDVPLRIYSSVNSRNFEKAIRQFKQEQLDADYYDTASRHGFYLDTKNRFIGALMAPLAREESLFLLDVDREEGKDTHGEVLKAMFDAGVDDKIVKVYPTKNGWHIVTQPFNPNLLSHPALEIKKDGLLLLKY